MTEFMIAGVSLLLLVPGIVEAAKAFGVGGKGSLALALGLGLVFCSLAQAIVVGLVPAAWLPWIEVVVYGLAGSLSLTGYYDLVDRTGVLHKRARGHHPF